MSYGDSFIYSRTILIVVLFPITLPNLTSTVTLQERNNVFRK